MLALWTLAASALAAPPPRDPSLRSSPYYPWPRQEQVSLDGTWDLAWTEPPGTVALPENLSRLDWFRTTVPGEVHWALHRAGKAPHPYVGLNARGLRWVEDKSWWYRKRFTIPAEMARLSHVSLVMEGVDYYGYYWLNGRFLGRSEGAFGAVVLPLGKLRPGAENELVVRVDCGGYKLDKQGGATPGSLVKSELWSGWKLGAHDFNTVGIWQPVRVVAGDRPCLDRPFVETLSIAEDAARVRTSVEVSADESEVGAYEVTITLAGRGFSVEPIRGSARVDFRERPLTWSTARGTFVVKPERGTTRQAPAQRRMLALVELTIPRPRLWWPNGLGDQPMYEAQIVLSKNGKALDRLTVPFGVRSVTLDRSPSAQESYEEYRGWIFHVNGRPLFVKGTNCMPIDALADVSPEQYEWSLSLARDAGIQMIRVWGGGILEPDVFYELCDRFGIMVWQDFPLNCSWQADKIDRQTWRDTVMWTIFRLRNHPSLVFWCGGNEFAPDDPANSDLVFMLDRYTRILDGTRPFMGSSPDEGDLHHYPQWDASWAHRSPLVSGPFVSEWGSHAMPSPQTYAEIVGPQESDARIGPTLLKMNEKLMQEQFPEIIHHWVEFSPSRLPQMLSRGSAYDQLSDVSLGRFSEAVNAGAGEFYKYSAEAARTGYPRNGGLLFWVWKRPWPIVGIQICDGLGQPLPVYYEVKRAFSSPWPCLVPPHLNYAPGEQVEMKTAVLSETRRTPLPGCRLTARLIGPDLAERQRWKDLPPVDVLGQPDPIAGLGLGFRVPADFARSFFFVVLELSDSQGRRLARNMYPFRCPPQLEDAAFRQKYRAGPRAGLTLDQGPWLRPQLQKQPTTLSCKVLEARRESDTRGQLRVEICNAGTRPAVMTSIHVHGKVRYVVDDAGFWLEPGESRVLGVRLRLDPAQRESQWKISARAWNAFEEAVVEARLNE